MRCTPVAARVATWFLLTDEEPILSFGLNFRPESGDEKTHSGGLRVAKQPFLANVRGWASLASTQRGPWLRKRPWGGFEGVAVPCWLSWLGNRPRASFTPELCWSGLCGAHGLKYVEKQNSGGRVPQCPHFISRRESYPTIFFLFGFLDVSFM